MSINENLKILVVDDEESIRDLFKEYLESATAYTILTASDGMEALEIIKGKEIDCCFTDLSMPRLDGLELAQSIHQYDNTIPVVIMTGYPSMDNVIKTLKNGVADFLIKPFRMNQILPTIDKVMAAKSLFLENILLKEGADKSEKLLKLNQELQQKVEEIETLNLILQTLDQVANNKDLFKMLVNLSGKITACDESHFYFYTRAMKNYTPVTSFVRNGNRANTNAGYIAKELIHEIAKDGMPALIKGNNGDSSIMAIPLKIQSQIFGILISIIQNEEYCFSEKDLYFLNFLVAKASSLIENLALYESIYESLFSTLYAFVEALEARDSYTKQHSITVSRYAMTIAEAYGCPQEDIDKLNIAGCLHDIGKIGIPDKILLKPGQLTDEEYEIIKKHPIIGSNIIGPLGMWTDEQIIIRHHHERFDGMGYPDQIKGEDIPLLSRILSVADVYDALTTDRSYRKKMSNDIVVKIIRDNANSQFDSKIVDVFLSLNSQGNMMAQH
jgi:putative nucleotidyltransferase with HDIG domain